MSVHANESAGGGARFSGRQIGIAIAALVVVGAATFGAIKLLGGDGGVVVPETGENAAGHFDGGPDELLYLSGTALRRLGIVSVADEELSDLESTEVAASPGSEEIAYVTYVTNGAIVEPRLHVANLAGDADDEVGPGVAPLWMPTGARIAYLRPGAVTRCTPDAGCVGKTEVVIRDLASGTEEVALDAGNWSLVAWAGEHLIVEKTKNGELSSVSPTGESTTLDLETEETLEAFTASPDGRWLLASDPKGARFIPLEEGQVSGEGTVVPLLGKSVVDAYFSHDSETVAAVLSSQDVPAVTGEGKAKDLKAQRAASPDAITEIVTFSPDSPEPVGVEQTFGADANVLWSVGNDGVVFTRTVDPKTSLKQGSFCPIGTKGLCRLLFSYEESSDELVLLRME